MIYAVFAMVMLTFLVGIIVIAVRVRSVSSGNVKIKYYRAMCGQDIPNYVTISGRCFNNMFEVPVLFYVVSTLFISLQLQTQWSLWLAWVFIVFRVIQAIIHLTYNNVLHRMFAFWGGILTVLIMWIVLLTKLS